MQKVAFIEGNYERLSFSAYYPALGFETFIVKLQKAKTRKNKDYFVLRATMPKEVAERIKVQQGDYVIFKAKKAEWYHLCNWEEMQSTWNMLPLDIQNKVMLDGIKYPGASKSLPQMKLASTTALVPQQL